MTAHLLCFAKKGAGPLKFYNMYWMKLHECRLGSPLGGPMWQASSRAEAFLRKAKQQSSHYDILQNLIQAVDELTREVKRLDNEVHRIQRDVQFRRRF